MGRDSTELTAPRPGAPVFVVALCASAAALLFALIQAVSTGWSGLAPVVWCLLGSFVLVSLAVAVWWRGVHRPAHD